MPARVFIIGDQTANGLEARLRMQPKPFPLWVDGAPESTVDFWVNKKRFTKDWDFLRKKLAANGENFEERGPQVVIVSLGLGELMEEQDEGSLKKLAKNANALLDEIEKAGAKTLWVMPPKLPKEGPARETLLSTLAARKVRAFQPSKSYGVGPKGEISAEGYAQWADDIAVWTPMGQPSSPIITPRQPGETSSASPGSPASAPTGARSSTGRSIALTVAGLTIAGVVVAAVVAAKRRGASRGDSG